MKKKLVIASSLALLFASISAIAADPTIDNLNKVLNGETNASNKYELFAQRADLDGYHQVAKLFRAISMAESIHMNNHKSTILSLGGKPDIVNYDAFAIDTTKENLKAAIKGETYEESVLYPLVIKQAESDKNLAAIKTFTYASKAESQHQKLYTQALTKLEKNKPADYCVSKISGATFAISPDSACQAGKYLNEDEYIKVK